MNSLSFNHIGNSTHVKINRQDIGTRGSIFLYANSDQIRSLMSFTTIVEHNLTINQFMPNFVNAKDTSIIHRLNLDQIDGVTSIGAMKI